jgi:hypothetical protein
VGAPAATPANPAAAFETQIAQMFSSIQTSSGGIKFGDNIVITGQAVANNAANATSMANVLQAVVSLASMAGTQAGAGTQNSQLASLAGILQGLKVTASGVSINLALSIPETQIESILNSMKTLAKPAVKPAVIKPASAPRSVGAPASVAN